MSRDPEGIIRILAPANKRESILKGSHISIYDSSFARSCKLRMKNRSQNWRTDLSKGSCLSRFLGDPLRFVIHHCQNHRLLDGADATEFFSYKTKPSKGPWAPCLATRSLSELKIFPCIL